MLVSACLLGEPCRYDGNHKRYAGIEAALAGCEPVPVCPEEAGGLGTPRTASECCGGDGAAVLAGTARVVARDERTDRTAAFVSGARACLARAPEAAWALLKEGSPSCGVNRTWIDGVQVQGKGVFAALVAQAGIHARSEEG